MAVELPELDSAPAPRASWQLTEWVFAIFLVFTFVGLEPFKIHDFLTTIRRVIEEAKFENRAKKLDQDKAFSAIASPIRRDILKMLNSRPMRLMEITRELGIEDHTKVVFHLKMLKEAGIIEQDQEKVYGLSEAGYKTIECLKKMEHILLD